MNNKLVGISLILGSLALCTGAEARRDSDFLIPPPPPTPVLSVPPQPVMLPYSEAYSHFKAPAQQIPLTQPKTLPFNLRLPGSTPPPAVRPAPNFTGLCLSAAEAKGFGKPRLPYNAGYGPGAALGMPMQSAPAMNTWFDSSLRWYANHCSASNYYNSLNTQSQYFTPESAAQPAPHPVHKSGRRVHRKCVVASR